MTTPDVSILIPVWGVERFVERCLVSALEQTLDSMEVVVVDDCGTDRSMEIVREVAARYPHRSVRIVTHDRNRGSAVARNTAISEARGRYVIFLDSDDWAEPEMCEMLLKKADESDADVVVCDFWLSWPDRENRSVQRTPEDPVECIRAILDGRLHGACWNKLARRSAYADGTLFWKEGLNIWEDRYASVRLFGTVQKIAYLDRAFIHYVQFNPASYLASMDTAPLASVEQMAAITRLTEQYLVSKGLDKELHDALNHTKLRCKVPLGLSPDHNMNKRWKEFFPEVNGMALKDRILPVHLRLAVWLTSKNMLLAKDLLMRVVLLRRRLIRNR